MSLEQGQQARMVELSQRCFACDQPKAILVICKCCKERFCHDHKVEHHCPNRAGPSGAIAPPPGFSSKYKINDESKPLAVLLVSYDARSPHKAKWGSDTSAREKASKLKQKILLDKAEIIDAARHMDNTLPASETYIAKLLEASANQDRQTAHAVQTSLAKKTKSGVNGDQTLYPCEEAAPAEKEEALSHRIDQ